MMNKRTLTKTIFLIVTLLFVSGCKEAITEPPAVEDKRNFFPNTDGSYFFYNVAVFDSTGQIQSGTRKSYLQGEANLQQTPYQVRIDSLELNGNLDVSNSYFRKSTNGVFAYFDTTGVAAIVPDSLRSLLTISNEYRLLYFPFSINQTWPVYNVSIDLGVSRIDVVKISAVVIEKDSITITFRSTSITKEVFKIQYDMTIITGLDLTTETFKAFAWIAEDTGFYKWEGDAELLSFFWGNIAYPEGTVVVEQLSGSNIP
ncbi:MAG: hypothetical protein KGZ85_06630 [Ignavibacterium sp.]|nr:hypothetical protein [Ignavibacterium sp.]